MAEIGLVPEGSYRNRDFYFARVDGQDGCEQFHLDLLSDPQTSGGLLLAVAPEKMEQLVTDKLCRRWRNAGTGDLVRRALP